jgi:hypothetical protein
MDIRVKTGLKRLKDALQEFLDLFGDQRLRFGIISSSPPVALRPEEWEFISRYVTPIRVEGSIHPGRVGAVKPEPLASGEQCLVWKGTPETVTEFVKWAEKASTFLGGHSSAFRGFSGSDTRLGALQAVLLLATGTEALASHVAQKEILRCEWLSESDLRKLPSLANCVERRPRFEVMETKDHGGSLSMAVLESLLGASAEDTYSVRELVRSLSEEFDLSEPLTEAQALFLHRLRETGERPQTFKSLAAGHRLLAGQNPTRFLNSFPDAISKHIGRDPGKGCWWKGPPSK